MTKHKFMNKEFQWTDELVKEFMLTYNKIDKLITGVDPIMQTMQEWKASHTPEVKRDWEIVSFKGGNGGLIERNVDGTFATHRVQESHILRNPENTIHSVRRLSDNEVFSVGDELCDLGMSQNDRHKISNIYPINGTIALGFGDDGAIIIQAAKKTKRTKLFTTEDGKDIFEGDKYWYVSTPNFERCEEKVAHGTGHDRNYKRFSNGEKAKEYVTLNKPCLSVADVIKCPGSFLTQEPPSITRYSIPLEDLTKLAKSKQS